MICVDIDELTPCLKDGNTGALIDTEVVQIIRKSFLTPYNRKNGWYVNWASLLKEYEVYALVIKGTVDIQGLVALKFDKEAQSTFIDWMVSAPWNNLQIVDQKKYIGVGGHLFAIAIDKSVEYGTHGEIYGFAANQKFLSYYVNQLGAEYIGVLHQFHFLIADEASKKIREAYTYDWTDAKI